MTGKDKPPNNKGIFGVILRGYYYVQVILTSLIWTLKQLLSKHSKLKAIPNRQGDCVVITGGARGIGLEVVKQLLKAEMRVIIGCRDVRAAQRALLAIRNEGIMSGTAEIISLDMQSLNSVRQFAKRVMSWNIPIQLLINNAGVMFHPFELTSDGMETHFQVNYLGHFLLTDLLLPLLVRGGTEDRSSRVINVTSAAHYLGTIEFDDLLMEKFYSAHHAYGCTKLMQVVSSIYLNSRYVAEHLPVRVYAVHPGMIDTELYKFVFLKTVYRPILKMFYERAEKGADRIIFAALSPEMEDQGGTYSATFKVKKPHPEALDTQIQTRLWEVSCDILKIDKVQRKQSILPNLFTKVDID